MVGRQRLLVLLVMALHTCQGATPASALANALGINSASPSPKASQSPTTTPKAAATQTSLQTTANPTPPVVASPPPRVVSPPPAPAANPTASPPPGPSVPPPAPPAPPGYTSVQAVLRVAGPNVTPFNPQKQAVLIYALASIMQTINQNEIGIILVQAATSTSRRRLLDADTAAESAHQAKDMGFAIPQFGAISSLPIESLTASSEGIAKALPAVAKKVTRNLLQYANTLPEPAEQDVTIANLQAGTLRNVVDVTVQFNTTAGQSVNAVIQEIYQITSTNGSLNAALQSQGETLWGVQLLSANSAKPQGYKQAPTVCNESWAGICLDGSGLSSAGVKGIIAAGVIVIVGALTGLCVWWDIRRRGARAHGELEYPDSPWHASPMARYLGTLTGGRLGTPRGARTPKGAKSHNEVAMTASSRAAPPPAEPAIPTGGDSNAATRLPSRTVSNTNRNMAFV
ncbi:hypothetical protein WJX73_004819 [Symbiochloris irregularis]|uniref:Uncharacterized protein n=1 Tax=Symbiochloris irregularis TaxID=706552 RepID=A0AAW1PAC4_9CHLO